MKLLIYLHSLEAGGAERVAASLANHWAGRGWQVMLATVAAPQQDFYALDARVMRIGFGLAGDSNGMRRALRRNLSRVRALRSLIGRFRPDAALSLMTNANVILALASRGIPGLCAIGSEHIYPARVSLGAAWSLLRRVHYRSLYAVVGLTPECAGWILRHTSAARAPVIPNAALWPLPVQEPALPPAALCRPGRRILLGVGRLAWQKHFDLLIDAFHALAPGHAGWDLVILGSGPQQRELLDRVERLGLAGRVLLPGVVGNPGQWYEAADLYAMSSRFEGFPNTLVEALAHGLPAVSVDCDTGPRDIVRHQVDGLLTPAGDAGALARALDRLMGDAGLRAAMAARAIEVRERFSIERVAAMWEDLFAQGAAAVGAAVAADAAGLAGGAG